MEKLKLFRERIESIDLTRSLTLDDGWGGKWRGINQIGLILMVFRDAPFLGKYNLLIESFYEYTSFAFRSRSGYLKSIYHVSMYQQSRDIISKIAKERCIRSYVLTSRELYIKS